MFLTSAFCAAVPASAAAAAAAAESAAFLLASTFCLTVSDLRPLSRSSATPRRRSKKADVVIINDQQFEGNVNDENFLPRFRLSDQLWAEHLEKLILTVSYFRLDKLIFDAK